MNDLDWKRHFHELRHQVMPIFLGVLVVFVAIVILLAPVGEESEEKAVVAVGDRVSLLSADVEKGFDPAFVLMRPAELAAIPIVTRVDWPMGSESGALVYNAQPFRESRHLGDDFNGIGGWDSDLGDSVYAVADGEVSFAGRPSEGWGRVVMVAHGTEDGRLLQSFYGHLLRIDVPVGARVRRGDKIGAVGKGDGEYLAHLHFEVRQGPAIAAGPGYGDHEFGRLSGQDWIEERRGVPGDQLNPAVSGPTAEVSELSIGIESPDGKGK